VLVGGSVLGLGVGGLVVARFVLGGGRLRFAPEFLRQCLVVVNPRGERTELGVGLADEVGNEVGTGNGGFDPEAARLGRPFAEQRTRGLTRRVGRVDREVPPRGGGGLDVRAILVD